MYSSLQVTCAFWLHSQIPSQGPTLNLVQLVAVRAEHGSQQQLFLGTGVIRI